MKKLFIFLAVLAMVGVAQAEILSNTSFEDHVDNSYGREMPVGYDLWTDGGNWANIPDTEVVTTDAFTGLASFQMDVGSGYSDVALIYNLGILPAEDYTVSGYIKGTGSVDGLIGVDMFNPVDPADWWWGGSTAFGSNSDWTKFSLDFYADGVPQFNFIVISYRSLVRQHS